MGLAILEIYYLLLRIFHLSLVTVAGHGSIIPVTLSNGKYECIFQRIKLIWLKKILFDSWIF